MSVIGPISETALGSATQGENERIRFRRVQTLIEEDIRALEAHITTEQKACRDKRTGPNTSCYLDDLLQTAATHLQELRLCIPALVQPSFEVSLENERRNPRMEYLERCHGIANEFEASIKKYQEVWMRLKQRRILFNHLSLQNEKTRGLATDSFMELMSEQRSSKNAHHEVQMAIELAHGAHAGLLNQRNVLMQGTARLASLFETIPGIHHVLGRIRQRKRKETFVLGFVIGFCLFFTFYQMWRT